MYSLKTVPQHSSLSKNSNLIKYRLLEENTVQPNKSNTTKTPFFTTPPSNLHLLFKLQQNDPSEQ